MHGEGLTEETYLLKKQEHIDSVGIIGSIINHIKLTIGVGLLTIPWAIARGSLIPSIIMLNAFIFLSQIITFYNSQN